MKRLSLIIFFLTIALSVFAHTPEEYTKRSYMIPMRDSVHLYTVVLTPPGSTAESPIIVVRTPYSADKDSRSYATVMLPYVERGYIIVYQDVRGLQKSEGEFENIRPLVPQATQSLDARDCYDTAEWLLSHVKSNGAIGYRGTSYRGYYAFVAGLSEHPAIKAVCPQAPVTDWFLGDDFHHNGAFMILDASRFGRSFLRVRKRLGQTFPKIPALFEGSSYDYFLGKTMSDIYKEIGADSLTFWKQMCAHPNYDEFWQSRNTVSAIKDYGPAVLVMGGTYDAEDLYGIFATYQGVRERSPKTPLHLAIGPFTHGGWGSSKARTLGGLHMHSNAYKDMIGRWEINFFDYYLRGEGEKPAPVVYLADGGGVDHDWTETDVWPPKQTKMQTMTLSGMGETSRESVLKDGSLVASYVSDPANPVPFVAKPEARKTDYMVSDQNFARERADVLTFETEVLSEDVTMTGPIEVDLKVAISGADADFVVKVLDVWPDGNNRLARGNVFRGRFRNSFSQPEFFKKGRKETVAFTLEDVCHVFPKGHRIAIQIQSSWFPLVDMNPQTAVENINFARAKDFKSCSVSVYLNSRDPSLRCTSHQDDVVGIRHSSETTIRRPSESTTRHSEAEGEESCVTTDPSVAALSQDDVVVPRHSESVTCHSNVATRRPSETTTRHSDTGDATRHSEAESEGRSEESRLTFPVLSGTLPKTAVLQ